MTTEEWLKAECNGIGSVDIATATTIFENVIKRGGRGAVSFRKLYGA